MEEFLTQYSLEQVLIFAFVFACVIKTTLTLWDWFVERLFKFFNKKTKTEQHKEEVLQGLKDIKDHQKEMDVKIDGLSDRVQLLTDSDKDDIKAWITEKHHYFCYELGYIDDYSLDCVEKRYSHYLEEGGNSYVATLMNEIRSLPKHRD